MVDERGNEDARDDGPGPLVAGGQDERKQLRLVADFRERDDADRDEQCFDGMLQNRVGKPDDP
jgi:hypothetical protein